MENVVRTLVVDLVDSMYAQQRRVIAINRSIGRCGVGKEDDRASGASY
jgi:hypothetical protein